MNFQTRKRKVREAPQAPRPLLARRPISSGEPVLQDQPVCACGGICPKCSGEQAKLPMSPPGSRSEHQAEQVASRVSTGESLPVTFGWERADISSPSEEQETCPSAPGIDEAVGGHGDPLPPGTREFMESRLGRDLEDVRVHTGGTAERSAQALGARAYTLGSDVVFGPGQYAPHTDQGRHLLAHELAHVAQQSQGNQAFLARDANPALAGTDWATRVNDAKSAAVGAGSNQALADLIQEALGTLAQVHQSTNTRPNVNAAITAGAYTELGTMVDRHINFDRNLTAKTGKRNQYGEALYRTGPDDSSLSLYIILSPNALNPVGPDFTRMAFEHELAHTNDFLLEWISGPPHAATPGEELTIYQQNFEWHFLDLMQIDTATGSWNIADDFSMLFDYYLTADTAAKDAMFDNMQMFYEVRIQGIPDNLMKYKVWFQALLNARPASDALAIRINGLPGLGLNRGDQPSDHIP